MTVTYLTKTASATFDQSGRAVVTMRPDVGQWWSPAFVRVSTGRQTAPFASCTVYHGAPNVLNATTYIDDTFIGNQDTSSIISGTTVQFGESVTAVFSNGTPGDVAILALYGAVADQPSNIAGTLPVSPGVHFAGHIGLGGVNTLLNYETNTTYTGNTTRSLGFIGYLPYLGVTFRSVSNAHRLRISFYADPGYTQVLGQFVVDIQAGGFFSGSVPTQGPYCNLLIAAGISPPSTMNLAVWSAPAAFNGDDNNSTDSLLLSAQGQSIGAGGNTTFDAPRTMVGAAALSVSTTAVSWVGHLFVTAFDGSTDHIAFFTPGALQYTQSIFLPPMRVSLNLKNNDAGAKLFDFSIAARAWNPGR